MSQIQPGNLCKIITAPGEPDIADILLGSGTGKVSEPYIIVFRAKPDTYNNKLFYKRETSTLQIDQCVMFLKPYSDTQSLVLSGCGYYIVENKNLEPTNLSKTIVTIKCN